MSSRSQVLSLPTIGVGLVRKVSASNVISKAFPKAACCLRAFPESRLPQLWCQMGNMALAAEAGVQKENSDRINKRKCADLQILDWWSRGDSNP